MGRPARVCLVIVGGAAGLGLAYALHHVAGQGGLLAGFLLLAIVGHFSARRKRDTRRSPRDHDDPWEDST